MALNKLKKCLLLSFVFFILTLINFSSHPASITIQSAPSHLTATEDRAIIHDNCLVKCPSGTALDNILIDHDVIILSSNKTTKFADWVAYKTLASYVSGPERPRNWAQDPEINVQFTLIPEDYRGMNQEPYCFDRGHQAPLASFKNHPKWYILNYLSNITPQKKNLNRGPWERLESAERKLLKKYGETYVLTGPYYNKNNILKGPPLKHLNYELPSGYWKIISVKERQEIKSVSSIFPQEASLQDDYCNFLAPLSAIESLAKLKFYIPLGVNLTQEMGCKMNRIAP